MYTREAGLKYVERYIKEARKRNIKIDKAFIFGSYAKNSAKRYSDIDIAIISSDFTDNPFSNIKLFSPLSSKFPKVEPHLYTWADYNGKDPFLVEEILKTGIEVDL